MGDSKPSDWVDTKKIKDPEASKPDDWDEDAPKRIPDASAEKPKDWLDSEPDFVPDPDAAVPDDWDEEEDGEWEAPMVSNPKCASVSGCGEWKRPEIENPEYKGKWSAPMIDNPEYKGVWAPQQISNPAFYECTDPVSTLEPIGAVAIEVWLFKPKGPKFSNILIGTNPEDVVAFGEQTWKVAFADAEAKQAEATAKQQAEQKQQRMDEGGMSGTFEWISFEAIDKPYISIPIVMLAIFLLFKACFGKQADAEEPEPLVTDAKAEDDDTAIASSKASKVVEEDKSEVVAQADGSPRRTSLRQRKKAEEDKAKDVPQVGDY